MVDFEPIVTPELFARVQALDGRRPSVESRHRDPPDFPLHRFVRCGACDRPLTGSWSRGRSGHYAYYRCANRDCRAVNVTKPRLEQGAS